ncbi:hypothetical protein Hanom_Chr15g01396171 [Helianthus anomalus]
MPTTVFSDGSLEGTKSVGEDKESSLNYHNGCIENKETSTINGEDVVVDKETDRLFGVSIMEDNSLGNGKKNLNSKSRKRTKKVGRKQMGQVMISVDNRPSSRKRPRMDVDTNGMDPFGLNALLGLNNSFGCKGPMVSNVIGEKEGVTADNAPSDFNLETQEEDSGAGHVNNPQSVEEFSRGESVLEPEEQVPRQAMEMSDMPSVENQVKAYRGVNQMVEERVENIQAPRKQHN